MKVRNLVCSNQAQALVTSLPTFLPPLHHRLLYNTWRRSVATEWSFAKLEVDRRCWGERRARCGLLCLVGLGELTMRLRWQRMKNQRGAPNKPGGVLKEKQTARKACCALCKALLSDASAARMTKRVLSANSTFKSVQRNSLALE